MTRTERELKGVERSMEERGQKAQEILDKADSEDRDPTPKENEEVQENLKAIKALKERKADLEDAITVEGEAREFGKRLGESEAQESKEPEPKATSLGDQFVESEGFKSLRVGESPGQFSTGPIRLKTTLLEGDLDTPGAGASLVPVDQQAGITQILFERLTIANLLASGQTNSNTVRYVVETVADAGSIGTIEEGADKPEAALEFSQTDEPVRKIASFLPVSDEMLEDAAQIRSYINARLSLFVQQEEENQLLNGAGAGTDLNGLLNRVPLANQGVLSTATAPNAADNVFAAMTAVRASFLEPDGIVLNTDDWSELRLLKDTTENYIGGSPFSNTGSNPADQLWGKPVVVTSAIAQGTALVGAFRTAAQIYRRGGLTVEASNSHSDFFRKNLTAIRAEERLALAVYRPAAFATADLSGS